jgi:hypothetical protein
MDKPAAKVDGSKNKPIDEVDVFVGKGPLEPSPCPLSNVKVFPLPDDDCDSPFGVYGTEAGSKPSQNLHVCPEGGIPGEPEDGLPIANDEDPEDEDGNKLPKKLDLPYRYKIEYDVDYTTPHDKGPEKNLLTL